MNGIVNVLKPPGMTSHDVVYFIRKRFKTKKVGHTGTLDPEAAGVLPICVGKSTKAVQYITDKHKKYRANVKFGIVTDTYDSYGSIVSENSIQGLDLSRLSSVLKEFIGVIEQYPPIYSAIKYNGKKLYQYALEGEEVDIKSRTVQIFNIELIDIISADEVIIDVSCSKGTYIRSLCHDIGESLGCGAHMSQLIRLESTPFSIANAYTLEEIDQAASENRLNEIIYSVELVFKDFPSITLKESALSSFMNGNPVYQQGVLDSLEELNEEAFVRIYEKDRFLGLGQIRNDIKDLRRYIKVEKQFF